MIVITPVRAFVTLACTALLAPPISHELLSPNPPEYRPVVTQDARAAGLDGYTPFPNFPHIELVEEGDKRLNPKYGQAKPELVSLISDAELREQINEGEFAQLQVRNFTPRYKYARVKDERLFVPFGLSLMQYQNFFERGTLNLYGILSVNQDGSDIQARIERFYDSRLIERIGRKYWLHQTDGLWFARVVAESQLKHWLSEDPSRLQTLLKAAQTPSLLP